MENKEDTKPEENLTPGKRLVRARRIIEENLKKLNEMRQKNEEEKTGRDARKE